MQKKVKSTVTYLHTTTEDILSDKSNHKFDVITCLEMLEHVPDPSQTINEFSSLLNRKMEISSYRLLIGTLALICLLS